MHIFDVCLVIFVRLIVLARSAVISFMSISGKEYGTHCIMHNNVASWIIIQGDLYSSNHRLIYTYICTTTERGIYKRKQDS